MPCRCCGASRPSKGFKEPDEQEIYHLLKNAAFLVLDKNRNNACKQLLTEVKSFLTPNSEER